MNSKDDITSLRTEIIESQKTQADFLKWKLIAVSVVGAVSLGFTPETSTPRNPLGLELLLCAIPLICAYVDFVSLHIMIRIVTIGTFLKKIGSSYEDYVFHTRDRGANPYIFEAVALHGSTIVFNIVLIGVSFSPIVKDWIESAYLLSGIIGVFVALYSYYLYTKRATEVLELSKSK